MTLSSFPLALYPRTRGAALLAAALLALVGFAPAAVLEMTPPVVQEHVQVAAATVKQTRIQAAPLRQQLARALERTRQCAAQVKASKGAIPARVALSEARADTLEVGYKLVRISEAGFCEIDGSVAAVIEQLNRWNSNSEAAHRELASALTQRRQQVERLMSSPSPEDQDDARRLAADTVSMEQRFERERRFRERHGAILQKSLDHYGKLRARIEQARARLKRTRSQLSDLLVDTVSGSETLSVDVQMNEQDKQLAELASLTDALGELDGVTGLLSSMEQEIPLDLDPQTPQEPATVVRNVSR